MVYIHIVKFQRLLRTSFSISLTSSIIERKSLRRKGKYLFQLECKSLCKRLLSRTFHTNTRKKKIKGKTKQRLPSYIFYHFTKFKSTQKLFYRFKFIKSKRKRIITTNLNIEFLNHILFEINFVAFCLWFFSCTLRVHLWECKWPYIFTTSPKKSGFVWIMNR